ncbi:MAG: hypothetical protein U0136_19545 [Bdellovibrionota bacterium]
MSTPSQNNIVLVAFGIGFFIALTVLIAVNFSVPVAAVFFTSSLGWAMIGLWYSGAPGEDDRQTIGEPTKAGPSGPLQVKGIWTADTSNRTPAKKSSPKRPPSLPSPAPQFAAPTPESPISARQPAPSTDIYDNLSAAIAQIQKLIHDTNAKLSRFEGVMAKRLDRTSNADHQSLIRAKKILRALEERLNQLNQGKLDLDCGKVSRETLLVLVDSDLVIAHDAQNALPGETPIPPLPPASWESTLHVLCKQIARKPSFLKILKQQQA